jgi:hypothetical protein
VNSLMALEFCAGMIRDWLREIGFSCVRYFVRPQTTSAYLCLRYHPREFSKDRFGRGRPLPLGSISSVPLAAFSPELETQ